MFSVLMEEMWLMGEDRRPAVPQENLVEKSRRPPLHLVNIANRALRRPRLYARIISGCTQE